MKAKSNLESLLDKILLVANHPKINDDGELTEMTLNILREVTDQYSPFNSEKNNIELNGYTIQQAAAKGGVFVKCKVDLVIDGHISMKSGFFYEYNIQTKAARTIGRDGRLLPKATHRVRPFHIGFPVFFEYLDFVDKKFKFIFDEQVKTPHSILHCFTNGEYYQYSGIDDMGRLCFLDKYKAIVPIEDVEKHFDLNNPISIYENK